MSCLICEIIKGDRKSYPVFEDAHFMAFLDIKPLFVGHCLLVPKAHYQTIYALPAGLCGPFLTAIQIVGQGVEKAMGAAGTFIANNNTVSQSIPHLHMHIVPRNKGDGLKGFFWPRTGYANEKHFLETQQKIKRAIG